MIKDQRKSREKAKTKLSSFFKDDTPDLVFSSLLTVLAAWLSLLKPVLFAFLVDGVLRDNIDTMPQFVQDIYVKAGGQAFFIENLRIIALLYVLLEALIAIIDYTRAILITRFSENCAFRLRISLFEHMERLPYAWHRKSMSGDLVQRCTTDVKAVTRYFRQSMLQIIFSAVLVLTTATTMVISDLYMGIVAVAVTPLLFISSYNYFKERREAYEKWDEAEGELASDVQEATTGIRVIKAFAGEENEEKRFKKRNDFFYKLSLQNFKIMGIYWFKSDLLCYGELALIIILGAKRVVEGHMSLALFLIFISFSNELIHPLRNLARLIANTGKLQISYGRLAEILDTEEEDAESDLLMPEIKGAIEFKNVDFSYPDGSEKVLKDISFKLEPGESLGILGPTGSGKSSILFLLQKLYKPDSGSILIDGIDISEISKSALRKQIGLILQESFIYSKTVKENIKMARSDASDEEIEHYAEIAKLRDDIYGFSRQYETMIGEKGVTLSGGQRQRLAIARTLIRKCPVIVFDDSLSAVDIRTDSEIREALAARPEGYTSILVSHRISTLSSCDKIIVIEDGKVTQKGSPAELQKEDGLYKRVYQIQASWVEEDDESDQARQLTAKASLCVDAEEGADKAAETASTSDQAGKSESEVL